MTVSRRSVLRNFIVCSVGAPSLLCAEMLLDPLQSPAAGAHSSFIRLDRNENAYGALDSTLEALRRSLSFTYRYPDTQNLLQQKIASLYKVKPEQVVMGCGSTDVLRMVADAFLAPGKGLMIAEPGYGLLAFYAQVRNAKVVSVPLAGSHAHDLKAMLAAADSSTGLVYICNPNNPTGTLTPRADLEEFLRKLPSNIPVVIDEAYNDYVSPTPLYASFLDKPVNDPRLIVTRTFSKIHALAGLRIGYAIAATEMVSKLDRGFLQFGVNLLALPAALAALDDTEGLKFKAKKNAEDRLQFSNAANARKVEFLESHTNFFMLKVDKPPRDVIKHFRDNNILVGWWVPAMGQHIRVTLGRPEEMKQFWMVWDKLSA